MLRIDAHGHKRRASIKRRDLLRAHKLQPRDLRRFDPSMGVNKSADITIKESVLLVTLGGVRCATHPLLHGSQDSTCAHQPCTRLGDITEGGPSSRAAKPATQHLRAGP